MVLHTRKAGQKHKEWNITMKSFWPRSQSQFIQLSYCSQGLQEEWANLISGGVKRQTQLKNSSVAPADAVPVDVHKLQ